MPNLILCSALAHIFQKKDKLVQKYEYSLFCGMEKVNHFTYIAMYSSNRDNQVEYFPFHGMAEDASLIIWFKVWESEIAFHP